MQPDNDKRPIQALDLLRESMNLWHYQTGLYPKLIRQLIYKLRLEGENRIANQIVKTFGDIEDRATDIAEIIAEYESPKLSRKTITKETNTRFVIEAPRLSPQEWVDMVEQQKQAMKLLENKANGK